MKKLFYLFALAAAWLGGCDNDSEQSSAEEKTLMETIAGEYWTDNYYFIKTVDGQEQVAEKSLFMQKIAAGEGSTGGSTHLYYSLNAFCCSPGGQIDSYMLDQSDGPGAQRLQVYRGVCGLSYNQETKTVRLIPNDRNFDEKGIFCGTGMRLHSLTPDRIEFDLPVNENTRREWDDFIDTNTTGIRVVWTRADNKTKENYLYFKSPQEIALTPVR